MAVRWRLSNGSPKPDVSAKVIMNLWIVVDYIEQDRYGDRPIVLYRDKEFDMDKEIKELGT